MEINSGGKEGTAAVVDSDGRLTTKGSDVSEQTTASLNGDTFNLNTKNFTLTTANETPVFYLKNQTEDRPLRVPKIFFNFGASTGGSGPIYAKVYYNISSGTILSAADITIYNFNAGSGNEIGAISKIGTSTPLTFAGGTDPFDFFFPSASSRSLIDFDAIILPRGSNMLLTVTPPAGNTSMVTQCGCNIYLGSR